MFDFNMVRFQRAAVAVPEFVDFVTGDPVNGHIPEVVVRELTADEKHDVARSTDQKGEIAYFDTALVVFYGAVAGELEDPGKGKPLFSSLAQVQDLPGKAYGRALIRLANEILYLSGLAERDAAGESTELERQKKG